MLHNVKKNNIDLFEVHVHVSPFQIYWLTKEMLQTFFANGSNRNVEMGYFLYSNKWIIATTLFASSIIVLHVMASFA